MDIDASQRISNSQLAVSKAEREAAEKITAARKRSQIAENEIKAEMDRQAEINQKRLAVEMVRSEDQLENTRLKGYEQVRDVKRAHEAESESYRRNAEKNLAQIQGRFKNKQAETESLGERALREIETKNQAQIEFQRKQGSHQIQALKEEQSQVKAQLHADRVNTYEQLNHHNQVERKALENKTRESIQQSKDHYGSTYQSTLNQHHQSMAEISHQTNQEIQNIRRDTAHRLDAYSSRQNDPFYKLVQLEGELEETDHAFILTAKVPEHEQGRIQVNVRGNELVVSGQRRNEESLELAPGRKQKTSSYQTFNETFPLDWPVQPKLMSREFRGDQLIVTVPKQRHAVEPKKQKIVERTLAERPHFPANLPNEKALARLAEADAAQAEDSAPLKPSKGYKTLA
jgi:HSP20 family molecular chaperone IbpA